MRSRTDAGAPADPMMHLVRPRLHVAIGATIVGFAVLVLSGVLGEQQASLLSNLAQVTAPMAAAVACWSASRRATSDRHQRGWLLLGASAASWGLGQTAWTYFEFVTKTEPFPSVADLGYLLAVPLALVAVWTLSSRVDTTSWIMAVLDALIVCGGLLAISWPLVLGPSWEAAEGTSLELVLTLAYPIGNLVVASTVMLAIMRSDRGRDTVPLVHIAAGLLVLVLADSVFVWQGIQGTETAVTPADVGWVAGYLLLFLAAQEYPRAVERRPAETRSVRTLRRLALPITIIGVAWIGRLSTVLAGDTDDPFMALLMLAIVGLLLIRYLLTLRENQALMESLQEKIGELTTREQQLSHQALHDPLTGLANRRLFTDRVEHALLRSRRTGDLTAVLFVDLDDFKTVNDSLGHAAGDRLLASVAARLAGCVRPGDTVARLGGDEFGVLLEEMDGPDHASRVASRILEALEVAFPLDGRQVFTRASIGVATADVRTGHASADLLSDADVALYAAKGSGKSTFREFERDMRILALERLELGQDLRRALAGGQFFCNYQPIVDLVTGRVVALEALLRWNHPTRGLVAPNAFIELAEEIGMIGEIGMAVLDMACWQAANWRAEGKLPAGIELHVNLSGRQLEDPLLLEKIKRTLASTGFPTQQLVLEITESVAVEVGAAHLDLLESMRSIGIRLAIDDFGTGYSSLNYLRALPVDVLKIDRAFAQTLDGQTDTVLLEAIVRLGHSLGIDMIAEGIEHEEQVRTLRRLGCRRAQGFLFHHPLAVADVPDVIATATGPSSPPLPRRPVAAPADAIDASAPRPAPD